MSISLYISNIFNTQSTSYPLKETSTLKANGHLTVGLLVLFQISAKSLAMRNQCQAKQGLPITYICF